MTAPVQPPSARRWTEPTKPPVATPRWSCPGCGTAYMTAALNPATEHRALAEHVCPCTPKPTLTDRRPLDLRHLGGAAYLYVGVPVAALAMVVALAGRAVGS